MDTEKIISTILQKAGKTDVTSRTLLPIIQMNPLPEGQEPDEEYFKKMVGIVNAIQGNVNHVFTDKLESEVKTKVDEAKKKFDESHKDDTKGNKTDENKPNGDDRVAALEKKIADMEAAQAEAMKKSQIESVRNSVKNGLTQKFSEAGLKVNKFFLDTAMSKLEIPEENANVDDLVGKLEGLYQSDVKAAGIEYGRPNAGGGGGASHKEDDEHMWDDVAKITSRNRPQPKK